MKKTTLIIISFLFCITLAAQPGLKLVIYDDFVDPLETYETLIEKFNGTNLVDSIRIIGLPIYEPVLKFKIDSQVVELYDILYTTIEQALSKNYSSETELMNYMVINKSGNEIPLSAIGTLNATKENYKPDIFIPRPETYTHNGVKCVRIEFFCKKKDRQMLKLETNKILTNHIDRSYHKIGVEYDFVR